MGMIRTEVVLMRVGVGDTNVSVVSVYRSGSRGVGKVDLRYRCRSGSTGVSLNVSSISLISN